MVCSSKCQCLFTAIEPIFNPHCNGRRNRIQPFWEDYFQKWRTPHRCRGSIATPTVTPYACGFGATIGRPSMALARSLSTKRSFFRLVCQHEFR
jgi:hypothetical protein